MEEGEGVGDGDPSRCKGMVTRVWGAQEGGDVRGWRKGLEAVGGEKLGGRGKAGPDLQGGVSICARGSFESGLVSHADVEMWILQEAVFTRGGGATWGKAWGQSGGGGSQGTVWARVFAVVCLGKGGPGRVSRFRIGRA